MNRSDPVVMLSGYPLFADLDASMIEIIAGLCRVLSVDDGATLFRRGDAENCLYGIRRGQIMIGLSAATGVNTTLAYLGPGSLFGEIALLDGRGRTADAVATAPTELFKLRRADIFGLMAREPVIGMKFTDVLCRKLRSMTSQVELGLTQKLESRIASRLLQLGEHAGPMLVITQDQLAQSVGATQESVNRQLRNLFAAGILELQRGRIILTNIQALRMV